MNNFQKFQDEQYRIEILSLTCRSPNFINPVNDDNFQCIKINGKGNILRLYPYHTSINVLDFIGNVKDSLFINKKTNKLLAFIYSTPHLIYIQQQDGKSVSELLNFIPEIKEYFCEIVCFPTLIARSYDGYCIEFFKNICNDQVYLTLGVFLNKDSEQKTEELHKRKQKHLDMYMKLLDDIISVYVNVKFIPYFIHPDRIVIEPTKGGCMKIISCNLFTYIFSPQNNDAKILSGTFSHPLSFDNSNKNIFLYFPNNNNNQTQVTSMLNYSSLCVLLDFFHSAFVTALWIFTTGRFQHLTLVRRNKVSNKIHLNNDKKKNKSNQSENEQLVNEKSFCNIKYGFCKKFLNCKISQLVHNYGCCHLIKTVPNILAEAIESSVLSNNVRETENAVQREFQIFKEFIDQLCQLIPALEVTL